MNNQNEKKKTKITESKFKAIKILLDSGETISKIAEYMDCSVSSVTRVKNSETYEDYIAIARAQCISMDAKKRKEAAKAAASPVPQEPQKQVVEYRQSVTVQATHYMEMELKKQTELLTAISNKLAVIIDDLYGTKEAK